MCALTADRKGLFVQEIVTKNILKFDLSNLYVLMGENENEIYLQDSDVKIIHKMSAPATHILLTNDENCLLVADINNNIYSLAESLTSNGETLTFNDGPKVVSTVQLDHSISSFVQRPDGVIFVRI